MLPSLSGMSIGAQGGLLSDNHLTPKVDKAPDSWNRVALVCCAVVVAILLLDQLSKHLVTAWIGPDQTIHRQELLGVFVAFDYVRNSGVAFGLLRGRQWLVSLLAILVMTGFLVAFWRSLPFSRLLQIAVGLIVGGAIGNLIDRTRLDYVVDFVAVGVWPRFNVADSSITIGLILLVWSLLTMTDPQENSIRETAERNNT